MLDPEVLRALGPWGAVVIVVVVSLVAYARAHRHYHVTLDVTVRPKRRKGTIMGQEVVPDGLTVFENYLAFLIQDTGSYVFCGLTKERGCVCFNTAGWTYEIAGTDDWGAPSMAWRPDGACIVVSMNQGGKGFLVTAIPGVYKDGRMP